MVEERHEERAARNQSLFREINEQVEKLNGMLERLSPNGAWVCECADTGCVEPIEMTLGEYEAVRDNPVRFAVSAGDAHVAHEIERVVVTTDRYWVVEKFGRAGTVANELWRCRPHPTEAPGSRSMCSLQANYASR